jgi:hypothetical protein
LSFADFPFCIGRVAGSARSSARAALCRAGCLTAPRPKPHHGSRHDEQRWQQANKCDDDATADAERLAFVQRAHEGEERIAARLRRRVGPAAGRLADRGSMKTTVMPRSLWVARLASAIR